YTLTGHIKGIQATTYEPVHAGVIVASSNLDAMNMILVLDWCDCSIL
ncbi:hypothetical protein JMJ77_0007198, partial [Colletotrichum scovillei]